MNNTIITTDTKIGTFSGTLLALLYTINTGELFKTCLFAAIGATVSFMASLFCKWIAKKCFKGFRGSRGFRC